MKKIFTLIAVAMMAVGAQAQIQTVASYTVTTESTLAGSDNTADNGTGCSVQLHGTTVEQKDGVNYGLKLDSESKYVQIDLDEALQEGDAVNISYFVGSNSTADNTNGVVLTNAKTGTDGYKVLATMYTQIADKKDLVTSSYTALGGEKKFFVYRISTGSSSYFNKIEVKRGSAAASNATTWDFTSGLGSDDKANVTADDNWGKTTDSEDNEYYTWTSTTALAARNVYVALTANSQELNITKGLTFARDNSSGLASGAVNFFPDHLNIANSNVFIKIPGLTKNDVVRVRFYSNNNNAERGFNSITNTDVTSVMSSSKTDVKDATLTVAADGDVTLKTSASINIKYITINSALPTTAINSVETTATAVPAVQKYVENGKLVIEKGGKKFNAAGAQLK